MPERLLEEVAFDSLYLSSYLAVREERAADGLKILGVVIAFGDNPDDVHAKLVEDQKTFGEGKRHFYKPATNADKREGWTVGGAD